MRKKPLRKCVSCKERKEKHELVRIVNNKEEGIIVDLSGRKNGRGAYLCKDSSCLDKAKDNNLLDRSLRSKVSEDIYDQLEEIITSK